jgi:hypothetical protein
MLHFAELARRAFEERIPLGDGQVVVWGSLEPNHNRDGLHINALVFGPPALRDVRRTSVWAQLRQQAQQLHALALPYQQADNEVMLKVLPVYARGDGPQSLVAYCAKYCAKFEGRWFEVGDLGLYVEAERRGSA